MEIQHLQKGRDRAPTNQAEAKQQAQPLTTSPSSSPSHDFSFTISLHPSSAALQDKTTKSPPPLALDLSPADDIFFHGHLLPLHLLSHFPVSPRTSTNSLDSFTLPVREPLEDQSPNKNGSNCSSSSSNNSCNSNSSTVKNGNNSQSKERSKHKSLSFFGLVKWRKGCEVREREDKEKQKKKLRFDVSHVLKRYMRMVRPLLFFRERRENVQLRRQPYSFSGNLNLRASRQELLRGRRGEYSAPASMRTSPTNSGLLLATATLPSSASDSTMEELQAAIQAAIAHCKNSIAVEEKLKH